MGHAGGLLGWLTSDGRRVPALSAAEPRNRLIDDHRDYTTSRITPTGDRSNGESTTSFRIRLAKVCVCVSAPMRPPCSAGRLAL